MVLMLKLSSDFLDNFFFLNVHSFPRLCGNSTLPEFIAEGEWRGGAGVQTPYLR